MSVHTKFNPSQLKILYCEEKIIARIKQLAVEIISSYRDDKPILCVCILKGAVMFYSDLMKELNGRDIIFDFITLSSYQNSISSSGEIKLVTNLSEQADGRHVLIVEDIVDTGVTIDFLEKFFASKNASDVKTVCLLDKPKARVLKHIKPDFIGFTLTDTPFVIGYGLDYAQYYRNLRDIYTVNL